MTRFASKDLLEFIQQASTLYKTVSYVYILCDAVFSVINELQLPRFSIFFNALINRLIGYCNNCIKNGI